MSELKTSQELRRNLIAADYFLIPRTTTARLSFPVPAMEGGRCVERLFITDMTDVKPGEPLIPRPYAWLVLDAVTGDMLSYYRCGVKDFLDSDRYPADCRVSNQVGCSDKESFEAASARFKEVYERIRHLYWQGHREDFSPAEEASRNEYVKLFMQVIRVGQQPMYQALAPDFFHWLGMGGTVADDSHEESFREALDRLTRLFENKIQTDAHKEKLFDNMHRELIAFRNGVNSKPLVSMAIDIITLIDGIDKMYKTLCAKEDEGQRLKAAMTMLMDNRQELEDILYRASFEPYSCPGDTVDTKRQRIVAYEKTDDPDKVNRIAERLGDGYEYEGTIIRPERIKIYKQN